MYDNSLTYAISDEPFTWDQATRFLAEARPALRSRLVPVPDTPPTRRTIAAVDTSLARHQLGLNFRPWRETLLDSVDALLRLESEKNWR